MREIEAILFVRLYRGGNMKEMVTSEMMQKHDKAAKLLENLGITYNMKEVEHLR